MTGVLVVMVTVNTHSKRKKGCYNTGMPTPPAPCTIGTLLLGSILRVLILDVAYIAFMTCLVDIVVCS